MKSRYPFLKQQRFWRSEFMSEKVKEEQKEEVKVEHKKKKIVIPGDLITEERKKLGQHVFIENGKVYSDVLGVTYPESSVAYVVPLHGNYIPQRDDLVVGVVSRETVKGYMVNINSIYQSYIPEDAARDRLKRGSIISSKLPARR